MARRSDHTREELYRMSLDAAREILRNQGLPALTARSLAARIGYSPGTLYNLFRNLDDLVVQLNGETLDALQAALDAVPDDGDTETRLWHLARAYIAFTVENRELWNVLFEHRLPEGEDVPDWYRGKLARLLARVEAALVPVIPDDVAARGRATRVLWAGLHGLCSLGQSGKLALVAEDGLDDLARDLIRTYLAGLPGH
ncbi:MAG: TetR/AcrR family transcriptional regulator [Hyphomicrobiales bacterium]|nr:TetR/AcrR family transcriptional regulator [Hyphomicrobiales bacterium]MCP5372449.1 TetR/AcrR family transcriptional regulator [Hyphomicrobiales bacterium]